jgi:hypothetical protein
MISLRLDPEVVASLREIAEREGTTLSELLRRGASLIAQFAESTPYRISFTFREGSSLRTTLRGETSSSFREAGALEDVS